MKPIVAVILAAFVALIAAGAAQGAPRGAVPARALDGAPSPGPRFDASPGGPVVYHGGPTLKAHAVYVLYWQPPGYQYGATPADSTQFQATLGQYVAGVAHDSGGPASVFSLDTQYSDFSGPGVYNAAFVAAATDPSAFPPSSSCPGNQITACVSDQQIQSELSSQIQRNNWGGGAPNSHLYFVILPKGVGGCAPTVGCAYQAFCGYHGDFGLSGNETIYAVVPYLGVPGCDNYERPNASAADAEIDVVSHEWSEAITDPLGSLCTNTSCPAQVAPGWFDNSTQQEIADKCVSPNTQPLFGPHSAAGLPLGGLPPAGSPTRPTGTGTLFTQQVNGHGYYAQEEYSNAAAACVQRAAQVSFAAPASGLTVSFDGSGSGAAEGPIASYAWNFGDGAPPAAGAAPSHTYAAAGTYPVQLTVTDTLGRQQALTQNVAVAASPAAPPAPPAPPAAASQPAPSAHAASTSLAALFSAIRFTLARSTSPFSLAPTRCPVLCIVRATLTVRVRSGRKFKSLQVGSGTLRLAAGHSGYLTLRLNARGRRLLASAQHLRVSVLVTRSGSRAAFAQVRRTITLSLRRRRR
ncbi:MAG: PKD domain-containing protein [Solirubrobacteraceae bacterium]